MAWDKGDRGPAGEHRHLDAPTRPTCLALSWSGIVPCTRALQPASITRSVVSRTIPITSCTTSYHVDPVAEIVPVVSRIEMGTRHTPARTATRISQEVRATAARHHPPRRTMKADRAIKNTVPPIRRDPHAGVKLGSYGRGQRSR
jgi:hypothetical protein